MSKASMEESSGTCQVGEWSALQGHFMRFRSLVLKLSHGFCKVPTLSKWKLCMRKCGKCG
jgi:hypothetical protein